MPKKMKRSSVPLEHVMASLSIMAWQLLELIGPSLPLRPNFYGMLFYSRPASSAPPPSPRITVTSHLLDDISLDWDGMRGRRKFECREESWLTLRTAPPACLGPPDRWRLSLNKCLVQTEMRTR